VTGEPAVTMSEQQTCGDCGDTSRQAEMNYTLVGNPWRDRGRGRHGGSVAPQMS
jgi:hypothetical protein